MAHRVHDAAVDGVRVLHVCGQRRDVPGGVSMRPGSLTKHGGRGAGGPLTLTRFRLKTALEMPSRLRPTAVRTPVVLCQQPS